MAFAVHAATADTSPAHRNASTLAAEQTLFLFALTFLQGGQLLIGRSFVARASLHHWPRTGLTLAAVLLLVALILGTVAFTSADFRVAAMPASSTPRFNQLRVASGVLELIAAMLPVVLIPLTKVVAPELPHRQLGLLTASACFLFIPAVCKGPGDLRCASSSSDRPDGGRPIPACRPFRPRGRYGRLFAARLFASQFTSLE